MKSLVVLFTICCTITSCSLKTAIGEDQGQKLNGDDLKIVEIIDTPDKNKSDLFVLANQWMNRAFESSKNVIQFQDKEAGIITGKAFVLVQYNPSYKAFPTYFIITIEVKDGKSRLTFDQLYIEITTPGTNVSGVHIPKQKDIFPVSNSFQMNKIKQIIKSKAVDPYKKLVITNQSEW